MLLQVLHVEIEMKNLNFQAKLPVQKGVGTPSPSHYTPGFTFSTPQKCPRCHACNSQVYYDDLQFTRKAICRFQSRVLLFKDALPWFLKEKAFPWSSTKPQYMISFYLIRTVSAT